MVKRMNPQDYFTGISPTEVKPGLSTSEKVAQVVEKVREQAPEPKIIYVDKPYPVEVPKLVEAGNPEINSQVPWGLITILGIIGIVSLGIVAIVVGGKKA